MINLLIMIILWTVGSVDYYLISFFLKYVPGNIYVNTTASTLAEVVGSLTSGIVYKIFGPKVAFCMSFGVAAGGGLLLILFPDTNVYLVAFFVLVAKFGITFAFVMVYIITPTLFPTSLTATAFGICNVIARFTTIVSPILAELPNPTPMLCYTGFAVAGLISTFFIKNNVSYD